MSDLGFEPWPYVSSLDRVISESGEYDLKCQLYPNILKGHRNMNDYLMGNKFLCDNQSAFMKARSYTTALVNVVDDLRLKLDGNCIAFSVLLGHTNLLIRLTTKYYSGSYIPFLIFLIHPVVLYSLILITDDNEFT